MKRIDITKLLIAMSPSKCYYSNGYAVVLNQNCIVGMKYNAEYVHGNQYLIKDLGITATVRDVQMPTMTNGEYLHPCVLDAAHTIRKIFRYNPDLNVNFHSEISLSYNGTSARFNCSAPTKIRCSISYLALAVLDAIAKDVVYFRECRKYVVFVLPDAFVIANKLPAYDVPMPANPIYKTEPEPIIPPELEDIDFTEYCYIPGKFPCRHILLRNQQCKVLVENVH